MRRDPGEKLLLVNLVSDTAGGSKGLGGDRFPDAIRSEGRQFARNSARLSGTSEGSELAAVRASSRGAWRSSGGSRKMMSARNPPDGASLVQARTANEAAQSRNRRRPPPVVEMLSLRTISSERAIALLRASWDRKTETNAKIRALSMVSPLASAALRHSAATSEFRAASRPRRTSERAGFRIKSHSMAHNATMAPATTAGSRLP